MRIFADMCLLVSHFKVESIHSRGCRGYPRVLWAEEGGRVGGGEGGRYRVPAPGWEGGAYCTPKMRSIKE